MLSKQQNGCSLHSSGVQRIRAAEAVFSVEYIGFGAVPYEVDIGLFTAGEPGVESGFHFLQGQGAYIFRQIAADKLQQRPTVQGCIRFE